ncbi:MAG: gluconate 5-dehydrogenase, partial [Deltaproteobacteria bacterium]|nr:gluconate 5-dehydrogenase [Deltaproteobacteria bacterium]
MGTQFDLSGKVAIVTGGGRGIGKAIALGLAGAGAKVVVCSRTSKEIEEAAGEISRLGGKALPLTVDLTANDQLENLVNTTVKEFG